MQPQSCICHSCYGLVRRLPYVMPIIYYSSTLGSRAARIQLELLSCPCVGFCLVSYT